MKLVDLGPRWEDANRYRLGTGVSFRCPECRERIEISLYNPIDGGNPDKWSGLYVRTGESFERLTLYPTVEVEGHWQGQITLGQVISIFCYNNRDPNINSRK